MDTGPIIILANDQKCCYYQSSIQYIARIITTILHHNRDTTLSEGKKVFLNVKDGEILIKPAKDIAKRLAGSIALDDVDLIDEIVESEDWL